jgi:hypothetical protein
MQQYPRNAPARRLTYCKSVVFKLWLTAFVVIAMMAFNQAAYADLTLLFDQSAYQGNVWIQVQDPFYQSTTLNFQATYANGAKSIDFSDSGNQVMMSLPVNLSDIGAGGLNITFSDSAVFYVFYDDPTGNSRRAAPSQNVSTQRFMPFELSMMGNTGDQGNLTAINYFTAPLSIRSYANNPIQNPGEPVLQQTGFGSATAAQIGARLDAATGGNPNAVMRNANGRIIRYLGPNNVFQTPTGQPLPNPWPSFLPYTLSIHKAGQSTTIMRTNGFNFADPLPVYQFGANMTANANSDGSLSIIGSITVSVNAAIKTGNPALPTGGAWSGATLTFSVSDIDAFNSLIYGQTDNNAVSITGQAWADFLTFTKHTLQDPTKPHNPTPTDPNYNPSLDDLGAWDTTFNMFIGEVTTGLLGGFFNSVYKVGGVGTALKDMPSYEWWSLNPVVAYSTIQTSHPYYNPYAAVIFEKSNNSVYGVPYSDRFGNGPLVQSVNYNGASVKYWVLGIGTPLPVTPALPGILMLLIGD